jgi:hypothetical protein
MVPVLVQEVLGRGRCGGRSLRFAAGRFAMPGGAGSAVPGVLVVSRAHAQDASRSRGRSAAQPLRHWSWGLCSMA